MSHEWLWLAVAATAGLACFFCLAHNALRHFSRARLEEVLEARGRLELLQRLFARHDALVQGTGLLYAASLVLMAAFVLAWAALEFDTVRGAFIVGGLITLGIGTTFGAVIPLAWARYAADSVLASLLPVLLAIRAALAPLLQVYGLLDALVRRLLGVPAGGGPAIHIEEEIRSVVSEGEREGAIEESQVDMIESVIDFKKADVTEIMTPRTDIISIEAAATAEQARALFLGSGHSRIPVTEGNVDTVTGILYAKDLLQQMGPGADNDQAVRDLMRKPLFVPDTKKLDELLSELQLYKVHIAIVLDEYGGTAGLVTIEDIIEEIFGEIVDEYEEAPPKPIRTVGEGAFEVEARVHIDELNDELDLDLPEDEDYETIGGFVLSRLGYIPKPGEVLEAHGLRITVTEAEERRIMRLRIDLLPQAPAAAGD